ncbi:organic hydroperoxide resistance protein [Actinomadura monticuli]|uniref:Organic hydroperoxide resistance protein n=1 Tax=Actinomadura monticuli TaxID=3097367 RepID=A0ABV4Q3C5_9ACTN
MTEARYTAEAHVTGGRNGRATTTDGALDLKLRMPKEMGGDGEGSNPEQLFAIGYAACFGTTLDLLGQSTGRRADDAEIDAAVSLIPNGAGGFRLGVELRISLPSLTAAEAAGLARAAHRACPYSNATRGNIEVALVVNGESL